jgi:hypothetical protein
VKLEIGMSPTGNVPLKGLRVQKKGCARRWVRTALFSLLIILALNAVLGCGRKAKPEPLQGESPIHYRSSLLR